MHREGISTPCARHKGQQPLIECAKYDFKIIYFSFFIFYFYFFGIDKGVAFASTRGVATNVYLRKTLEKSKRGLRILKIRVRELFTHREGISTPHAHHKGRQPLIECA